jgi:cell division protein FtsB
LARTACSPCSRRVAARRLREDPSAIESVARRDLGLIKPGEKVFIVKDAAPRK